MLKMLKYVNNNNTFANQEKQSCNFSEVTTINQYDKLLETFTLVSDRRLQGVNDNTMKQPDNNIKLMSRILRQPTSRERVLDYISP